MEVPVAFRRIALLFALTVAAFCVQAFVPLRTALQIGADEGFELVKVTLCLSGYSLYTEVWNDQPPLHTFFLTQACKVFSPMILWPRLITGVFTVCLLASLFSVARRTSGLIVATVSALLLIGSPGFVELSSSCMLEIPALAFAVASLWALCGASGLPVRRALVGGLVFGLALQTKLVTAMFLPLIFLIVWLRCREPANPIKAFGGRASRFLLGTALTFLIVQWLIGDFAYFDQLWTSHFASAKSFEYGSPSDHPFDWSILLKNWDATIPALVGIVLCLRQMRQTPSIVMPVAWLAWMLIIHAFHKPWWPYYYVHLAIPLCWLAGIAFGAGIELVRQKRMPAIVAFAVCCIAVLAWLGARVYLQIDGIRKSPQTYSSLVLKEIERLKPQIDYMYADEPIYSFHAGIPMPPNLAVVPLKRFWSGDMTNAKLAFELNRIKPGIMLLFNDTRELPFADLLQRDYQLIYTDSRHRLYALRSVVQKADL